MKYFTITLRFINQVVKDMGRKSTRTALGVSFPGGKTAQAKFSAQQLCPRDLPVEAENAVCADKAHAWGLCRAV